MLKIRSFFWINGLFLLLFGLFLFLKPELALRIIIIIFGIEVLISWLIGMFVAWQQKTYQYRGLLFFSTLLQLLFWILLLVFPKIGHFLVSLLVVLIGIAILLKGAFTIFDGLKAKSFQISTWRLQIILWALGVLFWLFLISNAFLSFLLLNVLLGLTMMFSGVMILIMGFQVKEQQECMDVHVDEELS